MTRDTAKPRVDNAARVILASSRTLFRAFTDPELMVKWRAPDTMTAQLLSFDCRVGGGYEMHLRYPADDASGPGKTTPTEDHVIVRFLEILPDERIEEEICFCSEDPVFAQPMLLTTRFSPAQSGTKVSFEASQVPAAISPADHRLGMESALKKLAWLTE